MNGKLIRAGTAMSVLALVWPAVVLASGLQLFLADPLRTMPEEVGKGVVLPGDAAPVACTMRKDFTMPLSLGEAVDLALCNNPQIKYAWAAIKIQAGVLGEARAAYLPVLTGAINRTNDRIRYSDSRFPSSDKNSNTAQASVTWRIFDFGGRSANQQAAKNLLESALANRNATLQRVLAGVIQVYFDAMTANESLKAKTENEELAGNLLNTAKAREKKGVISQTDTLRAKTALARASLEKNRAYGDYEKALAVLGQTLGLPGGTKISMPPELHPYRGEEREELGRWLADVQKNHPAIVAARKELEAAREKVVVARAAGLPTLNLSGNYYKNTRPGEAVTSADQEETTLGVTLSIPLFNGFSDKYRIQGAQAAVEQREAAVTNMVHQVALEVIRAYADATSALRNLEASAALFDAAHSALVVSRRKYDKGAADITEILGTQADLSEARLERVRCLYEWHSARLRLLASAGRMGRFAAAETASSPP